MSTITHRREKLRLEITPDGDSYVATLYDENDLDAWSAGDFRDRDEARELATHVAERVGAVIVKGD